MIFGTPPEVWVASLIAVFIKLQAEQKLTLLGVVTTFAVGVGSGIIFYAPLSAALGLSAAWHVPMACLISLTSDNLLKVILELSADRRWIGDAIRYWVTKRIDTDAEIRARGGVAPTPPVAPAPEAKPEEDMRDDDDKARG